MEIYFVLVIVAILVSFIGNVLVMRSFFKQVAEKLPCGQLQSHDATIPSSLPHMPWQQSQQTQPMTDRPEKNHVVEEDPNEMDYNENVLLPKDVKVEIEGGDSQVPPGFEEATKAGN